MASDELAIPKTRIRRGARNAAFMAEDTSGQI
jgi:hypothetical protein